MNKHWILRVGAATLALVALSTGAGSDFLSAQSASTSDSSRAVRLLANARGANPVMCELAVQSIVRRYGNWGSGGMAPDAIIGQSSLLELAAQDLEDVGVVAALANALSDEDTCVRRMAARLFGRVEHPSAVETLLHRLEDRDERTRQAAAVALGYVDNEDAVAALIDASDDRVAAVRAAATWALGEIEDQRAAKRLTQLLSDDPDPYVRRQAARALGNMY